jgi:EmrB/QacA subfamily drug resistance transporter
MSDVRTYPRRWWAFSVLSLCLLVVALDNTVVNVALPTLVRDLGATGSELQWIVDVYVLVFAGLLLIAGSISDRIGRKRVLLAGLLIFGVGSVGSAFAGTASHLIALRALMGVGGALIMPSTLSITTNMFSGKERGRAIGVWAGVGGIGIIIGPLLGGWLLQRFWWGSVFLINVPVIVVALVAGLALIPESRDPHPKGLDVVGALLSIVGLGALLYGIIEEPSRGWGDRQIQVTLGAALVLLVAFVLWERWTRAPMLDLRLFRSAHFTVATVVLTLLAFALLGAMFFLTQYLQFVLGYSALETGVRLTPLAVTLFVGAALSARLTERVGAKVTVTLGTVICAGGLAILALASTSGGYGVVAWSLAVMGLGMGAAMAPATDAMMGALPLAQAGAGSGVNQATKQVGGALGVAVLGSILSSAYQGAIADVAQRLPAPLAAVVRDSVGEAMAVAGRLGGVPGAALTHAAATAYTSAMGTAVLVGAGFALVGAVVALIFLPSTPPKQVGEEQSQAETQTPRETPVGV